jgi:methylthioribulose-1-phosphate dehydratase
VFGNLLADERFVDGAINFQGHEILKGITGVVSRKATQTIPIIENSDDYIAQSHVIQNVLQDTPNINGIFIRKHGLYSWGETVLETRRHVEIFEFMFELMARQGGLA